MSIMQKQLDVIMESVGYFLRKGSELMDICTVENF